MRSWVLRNRARLEAVYARRRAGARGLPPARTEPRAPLHASAAPRIPVVVLVPSPPARR